MTMHYVETAAGRFRFTVDNETEVDPHGPVVFPWAEAPKEFETHEEVIDYSEDFIERSPRLMWEPFSRTRGTAPPVTRWWWSAFKCGANEGTERDMLVSARRYPTREAAMADMEAVKEQVLRFREKKFGSREAA